MKKVIAIILCLISSFSIYAQEIKPYRPQEPQKPYPYYSEDVIFENKQAGIHLAGTLTLPQKDGVFPAVILISGSGPQNRDEELAGHKPFLVLSDYLTKNGIAVLRYDDRGTAFSEGDFNKSTSVDLATDVESALAYLKTRKEINPQKIGLIGHSEGGLIAPLVAADSKDVAFIILLGGPGIPGDKILLIQQRLIAEVLGTSKQEIKATKRMNRKIFDLVKTNANTSNLKTDLRMNLELFLKDNPSFKIPGGMTQDAFIDLQIKTYTTPWMQYFIKYDPVPTLKKVNVPVLALNGEKDLQITPKENLKAIKKAFRKAKNKNMTIKKLPALNHLFQEADTGLPNEYQLIEQTYSPIMLKEVLNWLNSQIQKINF
ncbi:MAG: alpha/beta fold hydrolase [Chryseobacterium sp.]